MGAPPIESAADAAATAAALVANAAAPVSELLHRAPLPSIGAPPAAEAAKPPVAAASPGGADAYEDDFCSSDGEEVPSEDDE